MKISYNWLKTLIKLPETPAEIGKLLTATGLEVEGIEEVSAVQGGLKGFVIGEVLSCEKFEVKDKKLSLTTVAIGADVPVQIVCGAANVAAGQKVIVATVGTTLYADGKALFTIDRKKTYGHLSEGMICAEDEIGVGKSHEGILILNTSLPNGTPATDYFKDLSPDFCIEIGLTPNRADAASHFGVARDLKAVLERPISLPDVSAFKVYNNNFPIAVSIEDTAACPRFCGLTIDGVTVKESPDWLKNHLKTIGINPINNIVDITNSVNHELGQPMHAYDWHGITGQKLIVKYVAEGTKFTTLDKVERRIGVNNLMICNAEEAMGIAGVFGGTKSGIKPETTRIYLEVAYFDPVSIRKTATFHGLKTDASFRFERGTDPNLKIYALKRAALLILELAGGTIASELLDIYPHPIENQIIEVRYSHINRLIGKNIDDRIIRKILESLDFIILEESKTTLKVSVPPYRVDVKREADVIEEILRIYGFEQIELSETLQSDYIANFPKIDTDKLRLRVSEVLVANGFNEVMNLSLSHAKYNQALAPISKGDDVVMLNPLSEDLTVMRQTMLFSGLTSLAYNINRRQKDLKIFEFGRTYYKKADKYKEEEHLALWLTGNKSSETWSQKNETLAFHDLTLVVQKILKSLKIMDFDTEEADKTIFQYGLNYVLNKKTIVSLGCVKNSHNKLADVKQTVFYADFDWNYLLKQYNEAVAFQEIARFPEVRRDLSLVIDKTVPFEAIKKLAFKTERKLLNAVNVFDIYEGENLGADKKSYSVSFSLQDVEKTLTDEMIDKTMNNLINAYDKELKALVRK